MPIYLCQCLCPQRHCIVAAASDGQTAAWAHRELVIAGVWIGLERGDLDPWCGRCGATADTWVYETTRTRFATREAAEPALRALEVEEVHTADLLRRLGLADDPPAPDPEAGP